MPLEMLEDNHGCFVCGMNNAEGMKLQFQTLDGGKKVTATYVPPEKYQGWQGVVHGGIIATLLDEVMAKAAQKSGYHVVTGELHTRFKSPAKVLEPLLLTAELESVKKKIIYVKATASREDGTVVAEAKAKMVLV
jgi:acyl-coenzyme A thioesterase PaaI-like protein